jgi:hypothetical protein
MGELKSNVRSAIHRFLIGELTGEEFKEQIGKVMREFEGRMPQRFLCQNVALIVQEREQHVPNEPDKFRSVWALLDQTEPMIREALNLWKEAMSK